MPLLYILILSCFLVGCNLTHLLNPTTSQSSQNTTDAYVDYFADNAFGNPLAIIQHPAGVHVNGVTYVSYQGPNTHPLVAAYHHKKQSWFGPVQAGFSDLATVFQTRGKIDSHGKPTLLIDDLGYIHIFYGGHGAGAKYGKNKYGGGGLGRNKHAISKRPYDISEWENLDNVSVFGTYNQAIKMDNGDIYLIYRHGAHRSDWVYQKSTDHGRTFDPAVSILKHKQRADIKATDSWYIWASKGQGSDIILSYDYHVCWLRNEGPKGLGHVTQRHDLYYMVLDTKTQQLRNISNEQLPIPVTREIAEQKTLVARTGDHWTFNGSATLDKQGNPHLAINIGENLGKNTGGPKQTHYYYWTGKEWSQGQVINPTAKHTNTDTRGDFYINQQQLTFLLGYKDNDDGVIASFTRQPTNNADPTFIKEKELLRRAKANWALTATIENAHPDAQILVAEKQANSQLHKIYLVGANGPIPRKAAEARFNVNSSNQN